MNKTILTLILLPFSYLAFLFYILYEFAHGMVMLPSALYDQVSDYLDGM